MEIIANINDPMAIKFSCSHSPAISYASSALCIQVKTIKPSPNTGWQDIVLTGPLLGKGELYKLSLS